MECIAYRDKKVVGVFIAFSLPLLPGVSLYAPDMAFDVEHFRYNKE
jgi:hypothetical protein